MEGPHVPDRFGGLSRPLRVLVVEDDPQAAASTALFLRLSGFEVRTAADGPTALEAATASRPDVVLLDLGLPGLDGCQVARALRAGLSGSRPLLVALTGHGREEDRRRSAEAGVDHHLVKPVEPEALRELLRGVQPD